MTMGSDSENKIAATTGIPIDSSQAAPSKIERISAASLYAVSSFLVIFVNKWVLSTYKFPSFMFLAAIQFLSTSLIIGFLSLFNKVEINPISKSIFLEIIPITFMFLGNVLSGLGSTQALNLPMFTALRRFSILFTMFGEMFILGKEVPMPVAYSVICMVGGALVAAFWDLSFDLRGYILIFLNDVFTAFNGIYMKKATVSGMCSKISVLYYNSLFSFFAMVIIFGLQIYEAIGYFGIDAMKSKLSNLEDISKFTMGMPVLIEVYYYEGWNDWQFCLLFVFAAVMGSVLNYAIFYCTTVNSALTTTVIGCLKNVLTTYIGMIFMPDYSFTWINFVGLNISIVGSLYYTYVTMVKGLQGFGN